MEDNCVLHNLLILYDDICLFPHRNTQTKCTSIQCKKLYLTCLHCSKLQHGFEAIYHVIVNAIVSKNEW